jgi:hypothetical protein
MTADAWALSRTCGDPVSGYTVGMKSILSRWTLLALAAAFSAGALPVRAEPWADQLNSAEKSVKETRKMRKAARKAEAEQDKKAILELLNGMIKTTTVLKDWGFEVPADQQIKPRLPGWAYFPVFGQITYLSDLAEGEKKQAVSFDVVYNGVRESISCEMATNKELHTVKVFGCDPPFGARAWPKDLRPDADTGLHFRPNSNSNILIAFIY